MTGIVMETIEAFDTLQDRVWADRKAKYNTGGDRWCSPIIHPTDGRIAFPVETAIEEFLTPEEIKSVVELTDDWFPKPVGDEF
jgi:hypothetical protein